MMIEVEDLLTFRPVGEPSSSTRAILSIPKIDDMCSIGLAIVAEQEMN
jgi:hypothetical protein